MVGTRKCYAYCCWNWPTPYVYILFICSSFRHRAIQWVLWLCRELQMESQSQRWDTQVTLWTTDDNSFRKCLLNWFLHFYNVVSYPKYNQATKIVKMRKALNKINIFSHAQRRVAAEVHRDCGHGCTEIQEFHGTVSAWENDPGAKQGQQRLQANVVPCFTLMTWHGKSLTSVKL